MAVHTLYKKDLTPNEYSDTYTKIEDKDNEQPARSWMSATGAFLRKHWFILSLTTLALTAAAVCIFFPPALIAAATFGLASSAAFAALGAAAGPLAIATVAATAFAAVFAIGGLIYGLDRAIRKCFEKTTTETPTYVATEKDAYQMCGDSAQTMSKHLHKSAPQQSAAVSVTVSTTDTHNHSHKNTVATDDKSCCGFFGKATPKSEVKAPTTAHAPVAMCG